MALIFTVEALLYHAIRGSLPGDEDDEDETSWALWLAQETALSAMGTLPFLRDLAGAFQGFSGGGAYGGVFDTLGNVVVQTSQGEVDRGLVRSFNDVLGIAAPGYPSTAIWRLADAELERREGEDVSPLDYLMGVRK
jgi:hypothetical protein